MPMMGMILLLLLITAQDALPFAFPSQILPASRESRSSCLKCVGQARHCTVMRVGKSASVERLARGVQLLQVNGEGIPVYSCLLPHPGDEESFLYV